ncbi:protein SSXA1-like [Rhinolophus ferrumequinum]|uniref:protein SSXA1-like n=1 Tax=Rhinolophus ferrumequinum TaxID=59479 RepID=UPI00140F9F4A|nr:protein SSXA1-like [Rhinolophus ferrumequinum]
MDRGSSLAKSHREDAQKSQEKYEAFDDISKNFSKKEWAKLGDLQKRTYVYMKRNYDYMTLLGLNTNCPYFMHSPNQSTNALESDSDEDQSPRNQDENPNACLGAGSEKAVYPGEVSSSGQETEKMSGPSKVKSSVWAHRLRERKNRVVCEEVSDPKEDD